MTPFLEFIQRYTTVSDDQWKIISAKLYPKKFESEQLVLREGEICRHLYFLQSGLLRFFVFKDGEEVTKFFTDAPYVFTSQVSFSKGHPSSENIQALEPCNTWRMDFKDAYDLLALPCWSEFIRKLVQEVQFYTEEILLEMQTVNAEDRYRKMLQENPEYIQRIPLKHLASYLGIQPQSLSRIRKQITSKHRM